MTEEDGFASRWGSGNGGGNDADADVEECCLSEESDSSGASRVRGSALTMCVEVMRFPEIVLSYIRAISERCGCVMEERDIAVTDFILRTYSVQRCSSITLHDLHVSVFFQSPLQGVGKRLHPVLEGVHADTLHELRDLSEFVRSRIRCSRILLAGCRQHLTNHSADNASITGLLQLAQHRKCRAHA